MKSYINLFRNYANFSGILRRSPFWIAMAIHALLLYLPIYPLFLTSKSFNNGDSDTFLYLLTGMILYRLLTFIPILSAATRRLHSLPKSGRWLFLWLIPFGGVVLLIFFLKKGNFEKYQEKMEVLFPGLSEKAEKARKGGWFWLAIVLLACLGWVFLKQAPYAQLYRGFSRSVAQIDYKVDMPSVMSDMKNLPTTLNTLNKDNIQKSLNGILANLSANISSLSSQNADQPNAPDEPIAKKTALPLIGADELENALIVGIPDDMPLLKLDENTLIDQFEVTNAQYAICKSQGACSTPNEPTWQYYYEDQKKGDYPVVNVTFKQAEAYCAWAGRRLPDEQEWAKAAQSADEENLYPWGNDFNPDNVNYSDSELKGPAAVSSFPQGQSRIGAMQMLGNAWEWVMGPVPNANSEKSDQKTAKLAVLRGGGWKSNQQDLSIRMRMEALQTWFGDDAGFRCALSLNDFEREKISLTKINAQEATRTVVLAPTEKPTVIEATRTVALAPTKKPTVVLAPSVTVGPKMTPSILKSKQVRKIDQALEMYIPKTSFIMGLNDGGINEKPAHQVNLSAYWIDQLEVSNKQYRQCVAAGACDEPRKTRSFRREEYYGNEKYDSYAVIMVDWQQANAYCEWAGARLPTEAEWENAAKGEKGFLYPWGNAFKSDWLNYSGTNVNDTMATISFTNDISWYGVIGLGGNVAEWVFDRYQEDWYKTTSQPDDPTGPEFGQFRVVRGSSWQTSEYNARTVNRFFAHETTASYDRGFRCARFAE